MRLLLSTTGEASPTITACVFNLDLIAWTCFTLQRCIRQYIIFSAETIIISFISWKCNWAEIHILHNYFTNYQIKTVGEIIELKWATCAVEWNLNQLPLICAAYCSSELMKSSVASEMWVHCIIICFDEHDSYLDT